MASEPSTQSRVVFQAADKTEEPAHRKLGKLTVKYNRKDLQRRLDIEEWIDGQLHLLFDCELVPLAGKGKGLISSTCTGIFSKQIDFLGMVSFTLS
ncbi:Protein phosphatase 1 regulatory subunit 14B [Liparis tanakae]|uniref:Protein phosphatase 1 regulatory subunit 14B n=1 Tax=Liparis tanakae TaxID=230148 RepID=A0A4Z2JB08_9TELE|nr:Protein phosphatase 1 regulatory subunit 14B [Liparis tanakae]